MKNCNLKNLWFQACYLHTYAICQGLSMRLEGGWWNSLIGYVTGWNSDVCTLLIIKIATFIIYTLWLWEMKNYTSHYILEVCRGLMYMLCTNV